MRFVGFYSCVPACQGCAHIDGRFEDHSGCAIYYRPRAKWTKLGGCESRTHNRTEPTKPEVKVRQGQQKQKKKGKK